MVLFGSNVHACRWPIAQSNQLQGKKFGAWGSIRPRKFGAQGLPGQCNQLIFFFSNTLNQYRWPEVTLQSLVCLPIYWIKAAVTAAALTSAVGHLYYHSQSLQSPPPPIGRLAFFQPGAGQLPRTCFPPPCQSCLPALSI